MRGSKSSVFPKSLHHILWFQAGYIHYRLRCFRHFEASVRPADLRHLTVIPYVTYSIYSSSIFTNLLCGNRDRGLSHFSAEPLSKKP